MKMYEILTGMDDLLDIPDDITPEGIDELREKFLSFDAQFNEKMESIAQIVKRSEDRIDCIDKEIKRLGDLKKAEKRKVDSCYYLADSALQRIGKDKLETELHKFSYRKSESMQVIDEKLVPKEFLKEKIEIKVDVAGAKEKLKAMLKEKEDAKIEGFELIKKQNLQIK